MYRSILCCTFLTLCAWAQQALPPASATEAMHQTAARSAQRKFDRIQENAARPHPDQTPTVLSENEINAWLASGQAKLPQGVRKLQMRGESGVIHGIASVDFDEITAGRKSGNPFLSMFRGIHEVEAEAHAHGSGGEGQVDIDSVSLDGVDIPRMALEFFVEKYVTPKHPEIGINSTFRLPYRIDIAIVGSHQLTLTQK